MSLFNRVSRRQFTASLLASSALAFAPRLAMGRSGPAKPRRRNVEGPSKLFILYLKGGIDDLYSFDPKQPGQVKKGIGPVVPTSQLVTHGNLQLAPQWAPLAPYLSRVQIVSGVQTKTVSHPNGTNQVAQMRTNLASPREISFHLRAGEVLAPAAPLHGIALNDDYDLTPGRGLADPDAATLTELHAVANDSGLREDARRALASALRTSCSSTSCEPLRIADHLLTKMAGTALPEPPPPTYKIAKEEWPLQARSYQAPKSLGLELSWAYYVLANDLAPTVVIAPFGGAWDTHTEGPIQHALNLQMSHWLKYFLDRLAATPRGAGRSLLDEVGVVAVSELGRFPYANSTGGKDHFPQVSALLMGPGLATGKFGETADEMAGVEVSLTTGRAGKGGRPITFDDLGRTLLEWVGHPDPEGLGYTGNVLEFCFA